MIKMRAHTLLVMVLAALLGALALPTFAQSTDEDWQQYTSADGYVTLSYPGDWFLGTFPDSSIVISNDPTLIAPEDTPVLDPGDIAITLYLFPRAFAPNIGIIGETTQEWLDSIVDLFSPDSEATPEPDAEATPEPDAEATPEPDAEATPEPDAPVVVFGATEIVEVEGIEYGRAPFTAAGYTDGMFVVWEVGVDGLGIALVGTAEGELSAVDDVLYPILSSYSISITLEELQAAQAEATPEATTAP